MFIIGYFFLYHEIIAMFVFDLTLSLSGDHRNVY